MVYTGSAVVAALSTLTESEFDDALESAAADAGSAAFDGVETHALSAVQSWANASVVSR